MANMTREQLNVQEGDKIVIRGKVSFARVDKLVEGEALDAENKRRTQRGMIPSEKPFRSITLEDPEIVEGKDTPLAQFYGQKVYTSSTSGKQSISIESKSKFAPTYGHIQNGAIVEIDDPQKNPANGQVVYLLIEAFKPKNYSKLGSSFNGIVFEEGDIKFYEGQGGSALAGFGKALGMDVKGKASAPAAEPAQPVAGQDGGSAFAGFAGAPIVEGNDQPAANPFGSATPDGGQRKSNPFA